MAWSETGYSDDVQIPAEASDNKLDNSDSRTQNMVHSVTDFLAKFDGEENNLSLVSDCIKEIQADPQIKTGFENLLKSGVSNDIIDKIKQELQDGVEFGLDEITLKDSVHLIIEDAINGGFRVYSVDAIEGKVNQKNKDESIADERVGLADERVGLADERVGLADERVGLADERVGLAGKKEAIGEDIVQRVKEMGNICMNYRDTLLEGHDDVKGKTEEKAKLAQQQLPEETRNQLKEKGYDDDDINNYILLRVTLNEVKGSPDFDKNQVEQFEKSVNKLSTIDVILKRLDNACNIPDTSLSSFSPDNIGQTRTELFNEDSGIGNESLKKSRDNNMASHEKDYNEMFPEKMGEEDIMKKYGSFLEGELKQFLEDYVNNTGGLKVKIEEIKKNENRTKEDEKLLELYNSMIAELEKKRKKTIEQTKNLMEEMCIISQIKGMYMCIGQEEGKDFTLNKNREITDENGVLTLKGHIDGVDFSVSHKYDTKNSDQHLKIKSRFGVDSEDPNTFLIGGEENYVDSSYILPNQEEIFGVISGIVQSNDMSKFNNLSDYLGNLQNNIIGKMDEIYKGTKSAHDEVENKVKGEKIWDSSLAMINYIKPNMNDLNKSINLGSNEKLFSFLKMIKFNVENSDAEEKNKLNQCIAKISEIIDAYKATKGVQNFAEMKYPPIIENYLKNQIWLENGNEDTKLGLVFDMLSYYNKDSSDTTTNAESNVGVPSKKIINDLYRDLFESPNNGHSVESVVGIKRKLENARKMKKDMRKKEEQETKDHAEESLVLDDESVWPPSPTPPDMT